MVSRSARRGNDLGDRLPNESLEHAGLAVGDTARVEVDDSRVTLEKKRRAHPRHRLEELLKRMPDDSRPVEVPWGEPVGAEEW
jgi:antitoxin component of MazEF toxin-antitoxin module